MTATTTAIPSSQIAQARCAAYTLIAFGFHYPDLPLLDMLVGAEQWRDWPDVLIAVDNRIGDSLHGVQAAVNAEAAAMRTGSDEAPVGLQDRYDAIFGHAVPGVCPAYEMEYGRRKNVNVASSLADLSLSYKAFGLEFAEGADGRPDHVSAECEFLGVLCAREAYALSVNNRENVGVCVDAEGAFLNDHLARWMPALCHRVRQEDPEGLYGGLARFADAFVRVECEQFGIHAGPQSLELRQVDPMADRSTADGGTPASGEPHVRHNPRSNPSQ